MEFDQPFSYRTRMTVYSIPILCIHVKACPVSGGSTFRSDCFDSQQGLLFTVMKLPNALTTRKRTSESLSGLESGRAHPGSFTVWTFHATPLRIGSTSTQSATQDRKKVSGRIGAGTNGVNGIHEVEGSIPFSSTRFHPRNSIHPYPVDIQSRVALNGSFSNLYASKSILLKTIL